MDIQPIELDVEGQTIRGNLYVPSTVDKTLAVLFLHGWTGRPNDQAAKLLAQNGFYALTISMRGHGESDGDIRTVTRSDSLADALTAYDFLRSQLPSGKSICVVGNSYGAYIAALVAAERPVEALSLRVPANYPDEGADMPKYGKGHGNPDIDRWRAAPLSYTANKALQSIHDFKGNIQIIEAAQDELITRQVITNYRNAVADAAKLQYVVMEGWPHSLGNDENRNQQFQKLLLDWLNATNQQL